jgi:hypothetical protein
MNECLSTKRAHHVLPSLEHQKFRVKLLRATRCQKMLLVDALIWDSEVQLWKGHCEDEDAKKEMKVKK